MIVAQDDLERRRPVWNALSDLFVDRAQVDWQICAIAETLADSSYSEEELDSIFYQEVFPACKRNFHSIIPSVWSGFNPAWLEETILANERRPWRKWRVFQFGSRWVVEDAWNEVKGRVAIIRAADTSRLSAE